MMNRFVTFSKRQIERILAPFKMPDTESKRVTFKDELIYESEKMFYILFLAFFSWIPYVYFDFRLHQFPVFAFFVRVLFCLIAAVLILLKLTKRFKSRPDILITTIVAALYIMPTVIAGTAGEHARAYIGGLIFVWMLPVFAPTPLKIKYSLQITALILFFLLELIFDIDFTDLSLLYHFSDLLIAILASFFLSYTFNSLRYKSWEQYNIISDLAEKAKASEQAKSDFLNTLSHEVRTPLTVISTYTQLAIQRFRGGKMDEQFIDGLEAINAEALRIAELASKVLSPGDDKEDTVDLAEVTHQLVRLYTPLTTGAQQKLSVDMPGKLIAKGNAGEITQIIWNLLDNAIKHGGSFINIGGNENDEYVYIIINNYDTVIPEEILPDILERGVSGSGGSGLGLAIANEIASKYGGRIMIESEHGIGTIVTLLLPVDKGRSSEPFEK